MKWRAWSRLRWAVTWRWRALRRRAAPFWPLAMALWAVTWLPRVLLRLALRLISGAMDTLARIAGIALAIWIVAQLANVTEDHVRFEAFGTYSPSGAAHAPGNIVRHMGGNAFAALCRMQVRPERIAVEPVAAFRSYSVLAGAGQQFEALFEVANRSLGAGLIFERRYTVTQIGYAHDRDAIDPACQAEVIAAIEDGACPRIVWDLRQIDQTVPEVKRFHALRLSERCITLSASPRVEIPNLPRLTLANLAGYLGLIRTLPASPESSPESSPAPSTGD